MTDVSSCLTHGMLCSKSIFRILAIPKSSRLFDDFNNRARVQNEISRYVHVDPDFPIFDDYVSGKIALLCDVQASCEVDAIGGL